MPRKLRPCGTYAAYARHLRNNEKPCEPCLAANRERSNAAPSGFNHYEWEMTRALEAEPPDIGWRRKHNGVWVHTYINDPHAETTTAAQARAAAEAAEREEAARQAEISRLQVLQLMQEEADEVAERLRKHHADNTPLMTAARTPL